jgi:hypothetical protein
MPKPYKFRVLLRKLRKHDPRFQVFTNRAKGSERMLYHPDIQGRPESFPLKCHSENQELRKGVVSAIIRRFRLPKGVL